MEPAEAINTLEVVLRDLVRAVLGNDWQAKEGIDVEKLTERRTEESKQRDGVVVDQDLLACTHLYELRDLIRKYWEAFKPALGDKKRFDVYLDRIEDFRNAPMHSRSLLPFERELPSGMVGELRNIVTIYRSQQGPDSQWYPVIESIEDSFGVRTDGPCQGLRDIVPTNLRLKVGDQVAFRCVGWDPQGRELHWEMKIDSLLSKGIGKIGSDVAFSLVVTEEHVSELFTVSFSLKSGGGYHRHGSTDAGCVFAYAVDPPI